MITADGVTHHSVTAYKNCHTLWQRDLNAAKNMFYIADSTWRGDGRPTMFCKPQQSNIATSNVVSSFA